MNLERWYPRLLLAMVLCGLAACTATVPVRDAPATAAAIPKGEVSGSRSEHTPASRTALIANAQVALPAASGEPAFFGKWRELPARTDRRFPVVLFLHGSSGLGLAAIADWQRWLAAQGIASVAPDSFALPERLTYKSPVDKATYERIHALRASEIVAGLEALSGSPWVDHRRVVLAGASEGAVAVARYNGAGIIGRIIYSWSCEDNYMVNTHATGVPAGEPVLNVISLTDPYFSRENPYLASPSAKGHCGAVLAHHKAATVVLIAGAPHTLLNLPAARGATGDFLRGVFGRP